MIFKCLCCSSYKIWTRKCYKIEATDEYGDVVTTYKLCEECGDQIDKKIDLDTAINNLKAKDD